MRRVLPIVLVFGCTSSGVPAPGTVGDTDSVPFDPELPYDTGFSLARQPQVDLDLDGHTVDDGDCDDGDATVHPGVALDRCNQRDDDCDGVLDEDAAADPYEPNDVTATDLGRLDDQDERLLIGTTFPEGDVDAFRFWVPDPVLGFFSVEAWTYGVHRSVDIELELVWVEDADGVARGVVVSADAQGAGGTESLDHGGTLGIDDSGWYELRVHTLGGEDCAEPYILQILVGGI